MKTALVLLFSLAAISCAEDKKPEPKKRLESVTWDLKSHKLIWVVAKGTDQNGKFVATSSDRYEIKPDEASMTYEAERRGFSKEEASSLHQLLDTLSLYCAESVVWWDNGEGVKLRDGEKAAPEKQAAPSEKKEKVDQRKTRPPATRRDALIAQLNPAE